MEDSITKMVDTLKKADDANQTIIYSKLQKEVDAFGSLGAMAFGARVGIAAENRFGAGYKAMAAEALSYAAVDTATQAYIYKVTHGNSGSDEEYALLKTVGMDMLIGSGLHLAGRVFLGAKTMWKTPTEANPLEYKIVMPTPRADIEAKYLFTKADTTGRSLILGDGGKFTSAISGKEIEIPKAQTMTSQQATEWLAAQANEMKAILDKIKQIDPSISTENLAIAAVHIRNAFVNSARQSIGDIRVFTKLEQDRPLWDYRYKESELAKQGYSGDALNQKIIDDAFDADLLAKETTYVGCFIAGTLVHTDKGLVPIEQLKNGRYGIVYARKWAY